MANDEQKPQSKDQDETAQASPEQESTPSDKKAPGNPLEQESQQFSQQQEAEPIDPALRKLEQVESARDPSRLLKAQLILQAKSKQPPENTGKKW